MENPPDRVVRADRAGFLFAAWVAARLSEMRGLGTCCRRGRVPFVPVAAIARNGSRHAVKPVAASVNGGRYAALQALPARCGGRSSRRPIVQG